MMARFKWYFEPFFPHQLKKKQKKRCRIWTPLAKLSGSEHVCADSPDSSLLVHNKNGRNECFLSKQIPVHACLKKVLAHRKYVLNSHEPVHQLFSVKVL